MMMIFTFLMLAITQTGVLSLDCFTCSAKPSDPLRCTRAEYTGTWITCVEGAIHCFRSVDRTTKEVNLGCMEPDQVVPSSKTGSQEELLVCSESKCNTASTTFPLLKLIAVSTLLRALLTL